MILLFDENISFRIVKKLAEIYPKCLHVTDITPAMKGDENIFLYAKQHGCVIVTFDEDFYDLQSLKGFPPKIIWLRIGNTSTLNLIRKLTEKKDDILSFYQNDNIGILEIH